MSQSSNSVLRTVALGIVTSLIVAELLDLIGGAHLRFGPAIANQLTGAGFNGVFELQTSVRNVGFLSGAVETVWVEPVDGTGLEAKATSWDHKRIFPLHRSTFTTELILRRTAGPLPYGLKVHYKTTNGDDHEQYLSLVCTGSKQLLRDTWDLITANGSLNLAGPSGVSCSHAG